VVVGPHRRADSAEVAYPGRRVYLVAVFGVSAVVALVALLIVGFRVFEFSLDASTGAGLIDRVRAPFGLLTATLLVFGYHFAVWRHDRSVIATEGLVPERRIGRVILVSAGDATAIERAVRAATGASVTVWKRSEPQAEPDPEVHGAPGAEPPGAGAVAGGAAHPDASDVASAFEGVSGKRVLVLAGPGERLEVVPLAD